MPWALLLLQWPMTTTTTTITKTTKTMMMMTITPGTTITTTATTTITKIIIIILKDGLINFAPTYVTRDLMLCHSVSVLSVLTYHGTFHLQGSSSHDASKCWGPLTWQCSVVDQKNWVLNHIAVWTSNIMIQCTGNECLVAIFQKVHLSYNHYTFRCGGQEWQNSINEIWAQPNKEFRKSHWTEAFTLRARRPAVLSNMLLTRISAVYGAASIETWFSSLIEVCALQRVPQRDLEMITN